MTLLMLILSALISDYQVPPEPEGVAAIRESYTEVKAHLSDEFGLYRTEIVINAGYLPYPALGNYQEFITLYWWCEAGENGLVLAVRTGEYAAHSEYTEVLFDENGALMFCFYAWDNGPEERHEIRRWYADGMEIHATSCRITDEGTEFQPPSEDDLIIEPDYYQELFDLLH
jgi:hypothetical protein